MPVQFRTITGKIDPTVERLIRDLVLAQNALETQVATIPPPAQTATLQPVVLQQATTGGGGDGITQLTGDVAAGPGSGSQIATLANSGVAAATYGDSTHVAQVAVDVKGRVTAASNVAITGSGITQLTGDVTAGPGSGSQAATIAADVVTNAKLANMAQSTVKGRAASAGTGDPTDLTPNEVSTVLDGATDPFLRTSAAGAGGITQLTGDVTAGPGSGSQAATIANNAVTDAKLRDSAAVSVIGRSANSSGDPADIAASADGQVLRRAANVVGFGAVDLADSDAVTGLLPLANLAARTSVFGIVIDGGSTVITTGLKGFIGPMPTAGTITKWTILSDDPAVTAGTCTLDLWRDTFANFPPTVADTIINTGAGGVKPAVAGPATNAQSSSLAHWTPAFSAGDVFGVNVDAVTLFTRLLVVFEHTIP